MRTLPLVLVLLAGCAVPQEVAQTAPVTARTVQAIRDSIASARSEPARRAVAARRLAAAGVTPLAGGAFNVGPAAPEVGGFVPGRHALGRPELVVLGSALDASTAPVVLEAARVLVARSLVANVPERTVMVAFWDGRQPAARGAASVVGLPLWPRPSVRAVVVVGESLPALSVEGVPALTVSLGDAGPEAVARVVAAALEAATYRSPIPADSTL